MNIASLCRREVVSIPAQASVHEAAALMGEEHVGSLVVVSGGQASRVVGLITDRDLALKAIGQHGALRPELTVADLAHTPPVAVRSDAGLREALAAMEQAGVRRLLVLDHQSGVVGLVSSEDLVAAIAEELAGLVRALRNGIERETRERRVVPPAAAALRPRPVFPAFGTSAH